MVRRPALQALACAWLTLAGCATVSGDDPAPARFDAVEEDAAFPIAASPRHRMRGYLVVPEDRRDPASAMIRLPVVVVAAASGESGLAPVVFIPGGPGAGGLSAANYPGAYPWTQDRDFIVYVRRGGVHAEPSLDCPDYAAASRRSGPDRAAALVDAAASCRAALESRGADPDQYNTAAHAADLEDLRRVLRYERLSLFALSYGTRLALTFAREHPGSVESMVLDSPLPHAADFDFEYPRNLEAVTRRLARICAENADCDAAYPDLERRFFAAVDAAVDAGDRDRARTIAFSAAVGAADDIAPALQAMDRAADMSAEDSGGVSDFVWGLRLAVWCAETPGRPTDPDAYAGLETGTFPPAVCEAFGAARRPASELAPTLADAPTLILAGELDALTPTRWGRDAARTLGRSRVIELPYGFHTETTNWSGDGCALSLAARFFEAPDSLLGDRAAPECVAARTLPPLIEAP
jgi:pimeloyl-ACP methyl ester carboxylesterase